MPHSLTVLVLAAGKGTRMNSQKSKVLHEIAGLPLVCHVMEAIKPLEPDNLVVVIAPGQEELGEVVNPANIRIQEKSLGTGDAVKAGLSNLKNLSGTVLVAFGADPMITTSTLRRLISAREIADPPDVVVLGFRTENPDRYGRLVLDADGKLERIVEVSEAHTIDKPVELYNAGVMAVNGAKIIEFLEALSPENGKKEYFDNNGYNMQKAFLRAPLDFAYVSSHFNPNRMHPVLHTIRAHNGVDYAAKRGSPVRTTGDGIVSFVGQRNGCGKEIVINHSNDYSTRYCHLEKFEQSIKKGKKVLQGNTIGFVGSTGLATGPHLHYEFKIGNKRIDPIKVKLPSAEPVPKNLKSSFDTLLLKNKLMLKEFSKLSPYEDE